MGRRIKPSLDDVRPDSPFQIGRRIVQARQFRNWNQSHLAALIVKDLLSCDEPLPPRVNAEGTVFTQSYLSRMEKGDIDEPRRYIHRSLARVLGVTPDWLTYGEHEADREALDVLAMMPETARLSRRIAALMRLATPGSRTRMLRELDKLVRMFELRPVGNSRTRVPGDHEGADEAELAATAGN